MKDVVKEELPNIDSDVAENRIDSVAELVAGWNGRPSWDEYFMATTFLIASRSACERLNVGCVLVSGGEHRNRIIAAGYNGFLPGSPHLSRVRDGHEQATVHAEQNAIADAARRGISVQGATAYITHFPCVNCAKIIIAAGVKAVKYHNDYRNDPIAKELFEEAGISLIQL
ncbi:cytidine/deoxycytidylate deaminase family protein [Rubellicoccus peritrichatus]|uniref:Cytidine/deoxycytidylate deaminase family protein n=1 Tax=Rubellicoccus peritrichatus TaxID=3080537 RepID=A0AAQ3L8G5_9BACT|nr:cytidine/deoxycytidylate deaminase family protein [Puniceicoccus sp. CR14]WOO41594.1 cytidine/deoxycytidylate deaminase family protein [Puniceicoccus sp. CR14]